MYSGNAGFPVTDFEDPGPDRRIEVRFFVTELLPVRGGSVDRLRAHNPFPGDFRSSAGEWRRPLTVGFRCPSGH
jgi:hypothetical protein